MSKYRTNTTDAPLPPQAKAQTPGELPPNRIPIFDSDGNRRAHVGYKASAATVARLGVPNAVLKTSDNGKPEWRGKGSK